jgi:hypothetical protein
MKHLILGVLLLVLVCPVMAELVADFQNPSEFSSYTECVAGISGTPVCTWVEGVTNSYYVVSDGPGAGIRNKNGFPMTYAAFTTISGNANNDNCVFLYDASKTVMWNPSSCDWNTGRIEVKIVGGKAYTYHDGQAWQTSGTLATNPYYISMGTYGLAESVDDMIWGDYGGTTVVLGMPMDNAYYIKKDLVNPSATGLYYASNDTLADSTTLKSTYSRSALDGANTNESVYLINTFTGDVYETKYTGTTTYGTMNWNITAFAASSAPYGLYRTKLGTTQSKDISYIGGGASVVLDADTYSTGDTATATYTIADDYWSPGTYTYRLDTISGTTGTVIDSQAVTTQSGVKSIAFQPEDTIGVQYVVLIRTSGGTDSWMNFDYAELNSYISFEGYVNDQDGNPLDGANVNISQNTVISDTTTIADGNYTASPGFYSGTSTLINVTKSGYTQYYVSLIPLVAKTVPLNFTLVDSTPTSTGLGIGGVARDGILTGSAITFGYGRPIPDATVYLVNASNGESYTKTTNNAGYYLCDEGASCFLTTKRPYDVWGEKARYDNSPNYTAVAA